MKNLSLHLVYATFLALGLVSCSQDNEVTYLPFQSEEDGKWGLISTDGKILFENEFRNVPTYVTDDRFFVQNQDGFWELYTAEETPKKLGPEFRYATSFSGGVAVATPRNGNISIINKEGEVKTELVKLDGKTITSAIKIKGEAIVVTCDTLMGAVNTKGETIVKPEYTSIYSDHNGLMIASDHAYQQSHFMEDGKKPRGKMEVLSNAGKPLYSLDTKTYWTVIPEACTEQYFTVTTRKERQVSIEGSKETYTEFYFHYFILDSKGDVLLKGGDKVNGIYQIRGDQFIYSTTDDHLCGVRKMDGTEVVKAEYDGIAFIGNDYIAAMMNGDESNGYKQKVVIYDNTGKQISHTAYQEVGGNDLYSMLKGTNLFVKEDDGDWQIINAEGNKIEKMPKMYDVRPYSFADDAVTSDAIDYSEFFQGLSIDTGKLGKFNFNTTPKEAIRIQQEGWSGDMKNQPLKPSEYTWQNTIWLYENSDGHAYTASVHFPQSLSRENFSTRKVFDGWAGYGNWYYYHNERVSTGFSFNNITPSYFELEFSRYNYYGKLRQLYKELVKYTKKWGDQTESTPNLTVLSIGNGRKLAISLTEDNVKMVWGKLSEEQTASWKFPTTSEKLESTYDGHKWGGFTFHRNIEECEGD